MLPLKEVHVLYQKRFCFVIPNKAVIALFCRQFDKSEQTAAAFCVE